MSQPGLVDITGRLRSPAATPGHWAGCAPPNKGLRYPADPPTVEEIIIVMRQAGVGALEARWVRTRPEPDVARRCARSGR